MSVPKLVERMPELEWIEIDGMAWVTGNAAQDAEPKDVLVIHINPATGEQCRRSPRSIGRHAITSRSPLTIGKAADETAYSLLCDEPGCSWHGYITGGHWVPA